MGLEDVGGNNVMVPKLQYETGMYLYRMKEDGVELLPTATTL